MSSERAILNKNLYKFFLSYILPNSESVLFQSMEITWDEMPIGRLSKYNNIFCLIH